MVQALTKVAEHDPPEHQFATVTSISISSSETGKQEEEWSLKVEASDVMRSLKKKISLTVGQ